MSKLNLVVAVAVVAVAGCASFDDLVDRDKPIALSEVPAAARNAAAHAVEGIVLTMFDERTNLSKQVAEEVRQSLGEIIFTEIIPRTIRLAEAPSFGKPALLYDIKSKGAQSYLNLARELINR